MQDISIDKRIFTVSLLNKSVKKLLETHFQIIWVEGEVSNLSRPSSGHIYFSLKDESAQVRCAMFRLRNSTQSIQIENGMHILARAKISLYEGRGDYQLIIDHIEERGEGLLRRRFELLKNSLAAQGLFDTASKKPLPTFPRRIAVITSPTGAAVRDVLSVLKRRFASLPIIIYPTQVQGEQAAQQIAHAIGIANQRNECDVIILCRGGGSLEDLWSFNEEIVARAIFNSQIPIVSGVGHEVDVTIADFVADHRAPTPSAAAELISPDKTECIQRVIYFRQRLASLTLSELRQRATLLQSLEKSFLQPKQRLQQYIQTLDIIEQQLIRAMKNKMEHAQRQLQLSDVKLQHCNPILRLEEQKSIVTNLKKTLVMVMGGNLQQTKHKFNALIRMLNTVSPLQTLERGYSIATKMGHVLDDVAKVRQDDDIQVQVKNGFIFCSVRGVKSEL